MKYTRNIQSSLPYIHHISTIHRYINYIYIYIYKLHNMVYFPIYNWFLLGWAPLPQVLAVAVAVWATASLGATNFAGAVSRWQAEEVWRTSRFWRCAKRDGWMTYLIIYTYTCIYVKLYIYMLNLYIWNNLCIMMDDDIYKDIFSHI